MFIRAIILIFLTMLIGAMLLDFRQQRIDAMHEIAGMHAEARQSRRALWQTQSRIAEQLEPERLDRAFERAGLNLEYVTPAPSQPHWNDDAQPLPHGSTASGPQF